MKTVNEAYGLAPTMEALTGCDEEHSRPTMRLRGCQAVPLCPSIRAAMAASGSVLTAAGWITSRTGKSASTKAVTASLTRRYGPFMRIAKATCGWERTVAESTSFETVSFVLTRLVTV